MIGIAAAIEICTLGERLRLGRLARRFAEPTRMISSALSWKDRPGNLRFVASRMVCSAIEAPIPIHRLRLAAGGGQSWVALLTSVLIFQKFFPRTLRRCLRRESRRNGKRDRARASMLRREDSATWLEVGERRHTQDDRQVIELDEIFAADGCVDDVEPLLAQPAQAPVAFHAALEFGIGGVGELEVARIAAIRSGDLGGKAGASPFTQAISCHWLTRSTRRRSGELDQA